MEAVVLEKKGQISVRDISIEEAIGPHDVRIDIRQVGICGSDVHYYTHGAIGPFVVKEPMVLGHEAAGVVHNVGEGVETAVPGDRVLIPAVLSCGRCRYCRAGRENLCEHMVMPGNDMDGAYAEFIKVPAAELVPVPADLPLEKACVIADAVSTPYHAVKNRGRVRPGDVVAVDRASISWE